MRNRAGTRTHVATYACVRNEKEKSRRTRISPPTRACIVQEMYRARRDARVHTRCPRCTRTYTTSWTYRCTFHERMRRLVYLANAIAELFICLLPGSASRECLYIRANTPRESYARGSPRVFFFCSRPTWLCCCRTHDSLLSFLRYVRLSISTFVSITSVPSFLFPLLSFSLSFSARFLHRLVRFAVGPLHVRRRKKKTENRRKRMAKR